MDAPQPVTGWITHPDTAPPDIEECSPAVSEVTVVVPELTRCGAGLWQALVVLPDGRRVRVVLPDRIVDVSGVQLAAAVVATIYADRQVRGRSGG